MLLNTKEMIDMFGNENHKVYYEKHKVLQTKSKNYILERAKIKYNINIVKRGCYELIEKDEFTGKDISENMENIIRSNTHKILCPIIVNKVMSNHNETTPIEMSLCDVYDTLKSIHKYNFNLIRYNVNKAGVSFDVDSKFIRDYYDSVTDILRYHLKECLRKLKIENAINWVEIPMVKRLNVNVTNFNGVEVHTTCEFDKATLEERMAISELKDDLVTKYKLSNKGEINLNPLAFQDYKQSLFDMGIDYEYKGFRIWYSDIERCKTFMNYFPDFNENNYIDNFVNTITDKIVTNKTKKYIDFEEDYISYLKVLCLLTLDNRSVNIVDFKSEAISETKGSYMKSKTKIGVDGK